MSAIDELFADRRGTDPYISALAVRVTGLERRMESVEFDVKSVGRDLAANTELTKQIHSGIETVRSDTADIVAATKWLTTTRRLLAVVIAGVAGTCGAIVAAIQLLKAIGAL